MKHHPGDRPVGKCKGCCLNMRTFCAAGLEPKTEWSRGNCRSRDDRSILEAYLHPTPVTGAKAARQQRRTKASRMNTEPHYNGQIFTPARQG